MTSRLERKWWFSVPVSLLAFFLTEFVMHCAGILHPYNFAQWTLYFTCFVGLQRSLSFAGWLLVLCLSPAGRAWERTR